MFYNKPVEIPQDIVLTNVFMKTKESISKSWY